MLLLNQTEPVTLVTRSVSSRDADGNDVWTTATVASRGLFDPGGTLERLAGGDTVVTQPTLYPYPSPLPVTVKAVDAVVIRGNTYEIDGDPLVWRGAPAAPGQVLRLKRVSG